VLGHVESRWWDEVNKGCRSVSTFESRSGEQFALTVTRALSLNASRFSQHQERLQAVRRLPQGEKEEGSGQAQATVGDQEGRGGGRGRRRQEEGAVSLPFLLATSGSHRCLGMSCMDCIHRFQLVRSKGKGNSLRRTCPSSSSEILKAFS
jgi:hypothetical protein